MISLREAPIYNVELVSFGVGSHQRSRLTGDIVLKGLASKELKRISQPKSIVWCSENTACCIGWLLNGMPEHGPQGVDCN